MPHTNKDLCNYKKNGVVCGEQIHFQLNMHEVIDENFIFGTAYNIF